METKYTLEQIEAAAIASFWAYHDLGIRDVQRGYRGDIDEIEQLFLNVGWKWAIDKVGGRYKESAYTRWCGIMQANCFLEVGDFLHSDRCVDVSLKHDIANFCFPSCLRLASKRQWERAGVNPPERLEPKDAIPGTILIQKTGRTGHPTGDHVTLCLAPPDLKKGTVLVGEGNAVGSLGGALEGKTGEGVVINERPLDVFVHCYRLKLEHFEGTDFHA